MEWLHVDGLKENLRAICEQRELELLRTVRSVELAPRAEGLLRRWRCEPTRLAAKMERG